MHAALDRFILALTPERVCELAARWREVVSQPGNRDVVLTVDRFWISVDPRRCLSTWAEIVTALAETEDWQDYADDLDLDPDELVGTRSTAETLAADACLYATLTGDGWMVLDPLGFAGPQDRGGSEQSAAVVVMPDWSRWTLGASDTPTADLHAYPPVGAGQSVAD